MACLAFLIAQFLHSEIASFKKDPDKSESLEVALQCLESTYGFSISNEEDKVKYNKEEFDLRTLVNEGKRAIKQQVSEDVISEENKKEAELLKTKGNEALTLENYRLAVELYSKALKLNPCSPVYYVNRAAAYTKLEEFELAIEDCEKGIEVDPLYSKAYARMGTCYYLQEKFSEASSAYKKALELQPDNVSYAQNVRMSENRIPKPATSSSGDLRNLLGGIEQLAGEVGGLGGANFNIENIMSNPAFQSAARRMLESGQLDQLMNNPNLAAMLSRLGGPHHSQQELQIP